VVALLAALAAVVAIAGLTALRIPAPFRVCGTVVDAANLPITGALVELVVTPDEPARSEMPVWRTSALTDTFGKFCFISGYEPKGSPYTLKISKAGFKSVAIGPLDGGRRVVMERQS
jgi:hypothetical protein